MPPRAAAKKGSRKNVKRTGHKSVARTSSSPKKRAAAKHSTGAVRGAEDSIRVRMYRVGFGDFFLVTVPTKSGPQHILIDCGVHAGNIGSMADCVADLVQVTERKLALVIIPHPP